MSKGKVAKLFTKIKLPEKVKVGVGMASLKVKKHSPEILLGLGFVSMGAAIISAVRSAREHDQLIADHEERLEAAKCEYVIPDEYDIIAEAESGEYKMSAGGGTIVRKTEKEVNRAIRKCYFETAVGFARLYARTTLYTAISALCFVSAYNIQARRVLALETAYTSLQEYIRKYEQRNIELNGKKSHEMCKYGYKEIEVEEEDPDTGEAVKEKKLVPAYEGASSEEMAKMPFHDQFLSFSNDTAKGCYTGIANHDRTTLEVGEQYIKDLYRSRGWVVVNDVLDTYNMKRTKEGMIEGWVKGCGPEPDFGIHDPVNNRCLAGFNHEDWHLDLNIHGNVFTLLDKKEEEERELEEKLKAERLAEEKV